MKDGSMFGDLKQYINEDYFREHRYIMIYCQGDWQRYMIFSCYIIREEEVEYIRVILTVRRKKGHI